MCFVAPSGVYLIICVTNKSVILSVLENATACMIKFLSWNGYYKNINSLKGNAFKLCVIYVYRSVHFSIL